MTTHPARPPAVDVRRADERFHTRIGWLDSHHSFSFVHHYDPANTHHGLLLVSNDDIVRAGTGFRTHPHQDMEIVTWVLAGELEHKDSEGNTGIIYPGLAQRMSAGTGIWHSEMNPRHDRTCTSSRCGCCPTPSGSGPATSSSTSTPSSTAAGSCRSRRAGATTPPSRIRQQRRRALGRPAQARRDGPGARRAVRARLRRPGRRDAGGRGVAGDGRRGAAHRRRRAERSRPNPTAGAEVLIWETAGAPPGA